MLTPDPSIAVPDPHHVVMVVTRVHKMNMARNPQKNIQIIADVKMNAQEALALVKLLQSQLKKHQEGLGPITFSMEAEFR